MKRRHRSIHFKIWIVAGVLLPAIVLIAVRMRPHFPRDGAAVLISPPSKGTQP